MALCDADSLQAAPPIRVERTATASLDECDARLNALSTFVRHDQMAEGPFAADVVQVLGQRGLKLSLATYGAAVTSSGASPDRTYAFCLPVANPDGAYFNHQPMRRNEMAILRPGDEFRLYRPPGFRSIVLRIDEGIVERWSEAVFGLPFSRVLRGAQSVETSDGAVSVCARHFAQICETAIVDPKPLADWAGAHSGSDGLAGELLEEVFAMVFDPTPFHGWSTRQSIVERAWITIENGEERTVGGLCMRLGVPIRTLDEAFRACLGVTPKRFILCVQLNKVRRRLAQPDDGITVTGTATQFGFYHFGHFGVQYRRLFSESPHRTLARGKTRVRAPGVSHGLPIGH